MLVVNDLIGLTSGYVPSFVKQYANLAETVNEAVGQWCDDVRDGNYPADEHSFE